MIPQRIDSCSALNILGRTLWSSKVNLPYISIAIGDGRDAWVKSLDGTNLRWMDGS